MYSPKPGTLFALLLLSLGPITPAAAETASAMRQRFERAHTVSSLTSSAIARFRERTAGKGFYVRYGGTGRVGSVQVYESPLTVTSSELRDSALAKIVRSRPRRVETTVLNSGDWTSEFGDPFATVHFKTVHTKRRKRKVEKREVDEYLFALSSGETGMVVRYATESGEGSKVEAEQFAADLLKLLQ